MDWNGEKEIQAQRYVCGFCRSKVASAKGFFTNDTPEGKKAYVCICPNCTFPSFIHDAKQVPTAIPGEEVAGLPRDVAALYQEARQAAGAKAYTASVMACNKLLMTLAVAQGAAPGKSLVSYIDYLEQSGFVPPNGRSWIDQIRKKGEEATNEIRVMTKTEAEELISFLEMLLKFSYEFPSKVSAKPAIKGI